jgi:NADPH-dependent glutamate synthase beta subunit-like oxidoreductase
VAAEARDYLHSLNKSLSYFTCVGCNISFEKVAREWRCKYDGGGPDKSASLKAAEELLQSYLPALKALPNAEVTRVMCGSCGDFVRRPR